MSLKPASAVERDRVARELLAWCSECRNTFTALIRDSDSPSEAHGCVVARVNHGVPYGMNTPDYDNAQFLRDVMCWLAREPQVILMCRRSVFQVSGTFLHTRQAS